MATKNYFVNLALLSVLSLVTVGVDASHASSPLRLTVECVKQNNDGSYTADLGYENTYRDDGYLVLASSIPDSNFFSPGDANRGQPGSFKYGRFPGQFKVTWDGTPLTWTVNYRIRGSSYDTSVVLDASNQSQRACRPVIYADCIMRRYGRYSNDNWYESYETYFSYFNPSESLTLPEGTPNRVTHDRWCTGSGCPSELSNQQPSTLQSGHNRGVFYADSRTSTEFGNTNDVYWIIGGTMGEGSEGDGSSGELVATSNWNYTRECDVNPVSDCLELGCKIAGQKGTKTAWFGYKNKEPFTVYSDTPNYYNSIGSSYGCEYNNYSGYDQYGRACIYPQPTEFPTGSVKRAFGVCFSGKYNSDQEGGSGEDLPIEEVGLNNYGYVQWRLGSGWYDYYNSHYARITSESRQCNRAPTCNTGSYELPCSGSPTNVFLQGSMSSDPDGDVLSYQWQHSCKDTTIFNANALNPVLGVFTPSECTITLKVSEQETPDKFSTACTGTVKVTECVGAKNVDCTDTDMTPLEVLLATGADDQKKLVERMISFLRKNAPQRDLSAFMRRAHAYAASSRALAYAYPDVVRQCANAVNCSSVSLLDTTNSYSGWSRKLDNLANALIKRIRRARHLSVARMYAKRHAEVSANIKRTLEGVPANTNSCS
jgi:hypothetical protein